MKNDHHQWNTSYIQQILEDKDIFLFEKQIIENEVLDIDRFGFVVGYKHSPLDLVTVFDNLASTIQMDINASDEQNEPDLFSYNPYDFVIDDPSQLPSELVAEFLQGVGSHTDLSTVETRVINDWLYEQKMLWDHKDGVSYE